MDYLRNHIRLKRGLSLLAMTGICSASVFADRVGYSEILDIQAQSDLFTVRHHHDWSEATQDQRYSMITTLPELFGPENDYAFVECMDQETGRVKFKVPSPALTCLWITPDSKYVVGLSNVQNWNPYQLVVWDSSGQLLFREHITVAGACFTNSEYDAFVSRFHHLQSEFADRLIRCRDSIWVDYHFMGSPEICGDSAWQVLYDHTCLSPYSSNFTESVTNWVW